MILLALLAVATRPARAANWAQLVGPPRQRAAAPAPAPWTPRWGTAVAVYQAPQRAPNGSDVLLAMAAAAAAAAATPTTAIPQLLLLDESGVSKVWLLGGDDFVDPNGEPPGSPAADAGTALDTFTAPSTESPEERAHRAAAALPARRLRASAKLQAGAHANRGSLDVLAPRSGSGGLRNDVWLWRSTGPRAHWKARATRLLGGDGAPAVLAPVSTVAWAPLGPPQRLASPPPALRTPGGGGYRRWLCCVDASRWYPCRMPSSGVAAAGDGSGNVSASGSGSGSGSGSVSGSVSGSGSVSDSAPGSTPGSAAGGAPPRDDDDDGCADWRNATGAGAILRSRLRWSPRRGHASAALYGAAHLLQQRSDQPTTAASSTASAPLPPPAASAPATAANSFGFVMVVLGGRARTFDTIGDAEAVGALVLTPAAPVASPGAPPAPPATRHREATGLMSDVWASVDGVTWTLRNGGCYVPQAEHAPLPGAPAQRCAADGDCHAKRLGDAACVAGRCVCRHWSPRERFALAVVGGGRSLVLAGGLTALPRGMCGDATCTVAYPRLLNDVWASADVGATWTQLTPAAPWRPRCDHALAFVRGAPWAGGAAAAGGAGGGVGSGSGGGGSSSSSTDNGSGGLLWVMGGRSEAALLDSRNSAPFGGGGGLRVGGTGIAPSAAATAAAAATTTRGTRDAENDLALDWGPDDPQLLLRDRHASADGGVTWVDADAAATSAAAASGTTATTSGTAGTASGTATASGGGGTTTPAPLGAPAPWPARAGFGLVVNGSRLWVLGGDVAVPPAAREPIPSAAEQARIANARGGLAQADAGSGAAAAAAPGAGESVYGPRAPFEFAAWRSGGTQQRRLPRVGSAGDGSERAPGADDAGSLDGGSSADDSSDSGQQLPQRLGERVTSSSDVDGTRPFAASGLGERFSGALWLPGAPAGGSSSDGSGGSYADTIGLPQFMPVGDVWSQDLPAFSAAFLTADGGVDSGGAPWVLPPPLPGGNATATAAPATLLITPLALASGELWRAGATAAATTAWVRDFDAPAPARAYFHPQDSLALPHSSVPPAAVAVLARYGITTWAQLADAAPAAVAAMRAPATLRHLRLPDVCALRLRARTRIERCTVPHRRYAGGSGDEQGEEAAGAGADAGGGLVSELEPRGGGPAGAEAASPPDDTDDDDGCDDLRVSGQLPEWPPDPATDVVCRQSFPPRRAFAAFMLDGLLLVLGGHEEGGNTLANDVWYRDAAPPATLLMSVPADGTSQSTFAFACDDAEAGAACSFECRVWDVGDGALLRDWSRCSSPFNAHGINRDQRRTRFEVRALDAAGNRDDGARPFAGSGQPGNWHEWAYTPPPPWLLIGLLLGAALLALLVCVLLWRRHLRRLALARYLQRRAARRLRRARQEDEARRRLLAPSSRSGGGGGGGSTAVVVPVGADGQPAATAGAGRAGASAPTALQLQKDGLLGAGGSAASGAASAPRPSRGLVSGLMRTLDRLGLGGAAHAAGKQPQQRSGGGGGSGRVSPAPSAPPFDFAGGTTTALAAPVAPTFRSHRVSPDAASAGGMQQTGAAALGSGGGGGGGGGAADAGAARRRSGWGVASSTGAPAAADTWSAGGGSRFLATSRAPGGARAAASASPSPAGGGAGAAANPMAASLQAQSGLYVVNARGLRVPVAPVLPAKPLRGLGGGGIAGAGGAWAVPAAGAGRGTTGARLAGGAAATLNTSLSPTPGPRPVAAAAAGAGAARALGGVGTARASPAARTAYPPMAVLPSELLSPSAVGPRTGLLLPPPRRGPSALTAAAGGGVVGSAQPTPRGGSLSPAPPAALMDAARGGGAAAAAHARPTNMYARAATGPTGRPAGF